MLPVEHPPERLVLPFDRARFARDALEATVAYLGIEHAPPGAARTRRDPDGSIVLSTSLTGPVTSVEPGRLSLDQQGFTATLRHLLPDAIELGALVGSCVTVELSERLHRGRCTADAQVRDASGALVLWARDGALPDDLDAHGLALRDEGGRGLAIAHRSGLAMVRGPGLALCEDDAGTLLVVVLRTGADDAAFAALRR